MKRRIEAKELICVGSTDHIANVQTMRSLMASEQFSTRTCVRCAGLLVNDWWSTGDHSSAVLRCVQCGHRIDPVILQNSSKASAAGEGT
ncbi:MAG TPA: hypothetical protein VIW47_09010 [Nitrospiraceae bacterium]|jgi:hypothetical protein